MKTVVQILDFQPRWERTFDQFLLKLTVSLKKDGWKVVFVFSGEPSEMFARELKALDAPYFVSECVQNGRGWKDLAKKLREFRPEVIQTSFISPFAVWVWKLKVSCGARHWIVADHSSGQASSKSGWKRAAAYFRGWLAGCFIDKIIAVSDFVARRNNEQSLLDSSKISVIYNGVDIDRFRFIQRQLSKGVCRIVFVGQLIPEKGVDLLIRAMVDVLKVYPQAQLKIAGAGHGRQDLERLAKECLPQGCVEFLGQVSDVQALLSWADMAVFPSRWDEAFGLVVIEAMACGLPVITSDAGGLPEVVGLGSEAGGLVFTKENTEELSEAMLRMLSDESSYAAMSAAGRARVEEKFTMERMVAEYRAVFQVLDQAS